MARGSAFDSDASNSGPHGALPSVPSSSTPLPGPVESSPASQSPNAPVSSEPRNKLSLKHFVWEEAITTMLKVVWEILCVLWYPDFTYRMRKSDKKQQCVSQEIWESWQKAWEDPAFKRKCDIFARNKRSETSGDGAGPSQHTGRLRYAIETSRLLAKKYGREPTPMEVFTYTHIKDHDGNTFVDKRALGVNENYSAARKRVISSQAGSKAESRIDELALDLEAVGGAKKRKVYGIRSQAYCGSTSASDTSAASSRP
ncbi:hypothetical protein JCGZ_02533 [Jatropha curcas]|uniref:Uncharacterized protein n=1 Tax=Jatropha curcas TaxID=180498 RepID=A0A067JIT0_JATCU|nr:hypothetical protein JCGZ_02533 [Jatropha curcas]